MNILPAILEYVILLQRRCFQDRIYITIRNKNSGSPKEAATYIVERGKTAG
jgi:hypothetical protein